MMMDCLISSNRGRHSLKSWTTIFWWWWGAYHCSEIASKETQRCHHKWDASILPRLEWRICAPAADPPLSCRVAVIPLWTCCPRSPCRTDMIELDWCWLDWQRCPLSWSRNMKLIGYNVDEKGLGLWVGFCGGYANNLGDVTHDSLDKHLINANILIEYGLSEQSYGLHRVGQ